MDHSPETPACLPGDIPAYGDFDPRNPTGAIAGEVGDKKVPDEIREWPKKPAPRKSGEAPIMKTGIPGEPGAPAPPVLGGGPLAAHELVVIAP